MTQVIGETTDIANLPSSSETVIDVNNLSHTYDGKNFALKDVNLSVRKGEVFGLLGRNGAGKTTLIKVLTTLVKPTTGKISILQMDALHDGKRIRKRIGVVQQGESFDYTTVQANFDVYGMLWAIPRRERTERRENLIATFGLQEVRRRRAFDLSGGEKRRLQVAREMLHETDILFLDEPTVGLDILMRRELLDIIKKEVARGLTVVFTTHNLEEADYLCDRIAVIDRGRILVMDSVENLKKLYGGRKTVEVKVGNGDGRVFYDALKDRLGETSLKIEDGSALILTESPKEALREIIDLSYKTGAQIDWLNVRENTLEDVFIGSVTNGGIA
ncbi:MAG TPA: ABC transporter ATP-binding protein [Candidatus Bathyarchaeia archaeon]|nr:ABC transporter ATP-binding protein [Candidatus Bathyarchaeia archaeon]